MGASPNRIVHDHLHGGAYWLTFVKGLLNPGEHEGCTAGPRHSPDLADTTQRAAARATLKRWNAIVDAAIDGEENDDLVELDDVFATLDVVPGVGPFPDTAPADWWDALTTSEKQGYRTQIVNAAMAARISA